MTKPVRKLAITGLGPDKPGIVAGMSKVLYRHGGNIEDTSMTILDGEFAMIVIATVPETITLDAVKGDMEHLQSALGVSLFVKDITQDATTRHKNAEQPFMISVSGNDKTGITYRVSKILAQHEVNITDLNAQVIDGEEGPVYIMMIEVEFPAANFDRQAFDTDLYQLAKSMGVEIKCRPIEPISL